MIGIIKEANINVSLQACKSKDGGFVVSAYEESTDKTSTKHIIIHLSRAEFSEIARQFNEFAKQD